MREALEEVAHGRPGEALAASVLQEEERFLLVPGAAHSAALAPRLPHGAAGAWRELEPLWRRSTAPLDREAERIGAAAARGAVSELVDALHPSGSLGEEGWRVFEHPDRVPFEVRQGRLIVTPQLAQSVSTIDVDDRAVRALSYPLPRVWQALDARRRRPRRSRASSARRAPLCCARSTVPRRPAGSPSS